MQIEGIPGESTDFQHNAWIDGYTFYHEFDTREGKACDLIHAQVAMDRSFPDLIATARSGAVLSSVVIDGVVPIHPHELRVRYRLIEARIVAIQCGKVFPGPGGPGTVSLVFSFQRFELTHRRYNPKNMELVEEAVRQWAANSPVCPVPHGDRP